MSNPQQQFSEDGLPTTPVFDSQGKPMRQAPPGPPVIESDTEDMLTQLALRHARHVFLHAVTLGEYSKIVEGDDRELNPNQRLGMMEWYGILVTATNDLGAVIAGMEKEGVEQ